MENRPIAIAIRSKKLGVLIQSARLAFYLQVPMDYFWGREVIDLGQKGLKIYEKDRLMRLRNRVIGASIRQARLKAGLTTLELATSADISEEQLNKYELGEVSIPLPVLEILANGINRTIKDFQDNRGPIGTWIKQQRAMQHFAELSPELQDFISKPINRPYLEIAQRLSEMSVEKLRTVAEGLLEITL
jgi:transcriptional regulator with XRE-family HTH domain